MELNLEKQSNSVAPELAEETPQQKHIRHARRGSETGSRQKAHLGVKYITHKMSELRLLDLWARSSDFLNQVFVLMLVKFGDLFQFEPGCLGLAGCLQHLGKPVVRLRPGRVER